MIAKGRLRALRERGITIDQTGRARRDGAFLSTAALKRAAAAAARATKKRRQPARKPTARKPTKKPTRKLAKKPTHKPAKKPARKPAKKPATPEAPPPADYSDFTPKGREAIRYLPAKEQPSMAAILRRLSPARRQATIDLLLQEREEGRPTKKEEKTEDRLKRMAEKIRKAKEAKKWFQTAKDELRRAVRVATKNPKRAYGFVPRFKGYQKVRGLFAGYRYTKFIEREGHVQEKLKEKFPKDFRRDLHAQAVHLRTYMTQGDGGAGRRAILEKTLLAGRRCIDERLVNKKTGRPLHIYQMYIARIRILIRIQDASIYHGYATHPINNKNPKAVMDVRGLSGFEKVLPGENPKVALDRLIERLEVQLDDNIHDGLPVVYVKSLEIMFDTEPQ